MLVFSFYPSVNEVADSLWTSREVATTSPFMLIGDSSATIDGLYERRERWGLSYFVCLDEDIDRMIPVVRKLAG
jgi:hypothetical protein